MSISPDYFRSDIQCRICFDADSTQENPLINPCLCNGTSKYVHKNCIQHWREVNSQNTYFWKCRECNHDYNIVKSHPKETMVFIEENISKLRSAQLFAGLYFIAFFSSFFMRTVDRVLYYPLLYLLTNFATPSKNLVILLQKEEMYNIQFYFSVIIMFVSFISYLLLLVRTTMQIQRFFTYWKYMSLPYIIFLGSSIHLYYFGLITDQDIESIENTFAIETMLSFTNLYIYSFILELHNKIIYNMNKQSIGDIRNIEIPR